MVCLRSVNILRDELREADEEIIWVVFVLFCRSRGPVWQEQGTPFRKQCEKKHVKRKEHCKGGKKNDKVNKKAEQQTTRGTTIAIAVVGVREKK